MWTSTRVVVLVGRGRLLAALVADVPEATRGDLEATRKRPGSDEVPEPHEGSEVIAA
jgi:hypothetical protein